MKASMLLSVPVLSQSGTLPLSASSRNQNRSALSWILTSLPVRFAMLVALTIALSKIAGGDSASGAKPTISGINPKPISARVSNSEHIPRDAAKDDK